MAGHSQSPSDRAIASGINGELPNGFPSRFWSMNQIAERGTWQRSLADAIRTFLAEAGSTCQVTVSQDTKPFSFSKSTCLVSGSHETVSTTVVLCIKAIDLKSFQLVYCGALLRDLQIEICDQLPPDWTCRMLCIKPNIDGLSSVERDPPLFGQARFGRFELLKGEAVKELTNQYHPLVDVFLDDVYQAIGSQLSPEAWTNAQRTLENSWRKRLRYRVEPDGLITAEDFELLMNTVHHLTVKFGLPSPSHRHGNGGEFSTSRRKR